MMGVTFIVLAAVAVLAAVLLIGSLLLRFRPDRYSGGTSLADTYEGAMTLLHLMQADRDHAASDARRSGRPLRESLGRNYGRVRDHAAKVVGTLTDDEIDALSRRLASAWLDGTSAPEDVATFLREERELVAGAPHTVTGHLVRFARRFGDAFQARQVEQTDSTGSDKED